MGVYALDVGCLRPIVAVVGAHGATDLAAWQWPPIYAACCFVPLPSHAVTGAFVATSIAHFAEDCGPDGSLALHSLAGFLWIAGGAQRGLELMIAYLACVHTPLHYVRCWRRRRWGALGAAALATLTALATTRHVQVVSVGHSIQRLVIAHVFTEWCVQRRRESRAGSVIS
tara:strand:+ start:1574 stop:2086 length:513 start_codon:yes stop_codon:yes gene_type:complete